MNIHLIVSIRSKLPSSIVKKFDVRFGDTVKSFNQHKELLEDEVWAAYLARVLGQKPGQCICKVLGQITI